MPALATLGTLGSLLLNAYGQSQSRDVTEKSRGLLDKRISDLDAWYKTEANKDYTQSKEGKATTRRLENQMREAVEAQGSNALRTGATAEAKVAAQGEGQEKFAEALSNLSGLSTQRRDIARRDYTSQMGNLLNQKAGMFEGEQQNWQNLATNISTALGSFGPLGTGASTTTDKGIGDFPIDKINPTQTGGITTPDLLKLR